MAVGRSQLREIGSLPREISGGYLMADRTAFLKTSWKRCVERFNLDVGMRPHLDSLTSQEVREHREPFGDLLETIDEELDHIWLPLASANFGASFSNMAGTIVYYRSDQTSGNHVESERAGTLWAEGVAGTNGVGTCVIERRPTAVFKTEHFFRDFSSMSCAAAPVLSPDAEIAGILNFCTADPNLREDLFLMVAGLARKTAERLSNHLFRRRYAGDILLKARSEAGTILLAVNDDAQVIGANQLARRWLDLSDGPLNPEKLTSLLHLNTEAPAEIYQNGMFVVHHQDGHVVFHANRKTPSPVRSHLNASSKKPETTRTNKSAHDGVARLTVDECLGSDPRMAVQRRVLRRVSGSGLPVLLLGETGCGKDTLARAMHAEGARRDRPFVAFNCAAIPETLIDSELFGYAVGAFTGARREGNMGRLVEADGGTLFLDELGDMPLALQTRLLRVLESGEVSPLGAGKTRVIDVQVIAATNQDLKARVAEGRFRSDLYHRLAGVVVNLLPVRDRDDAVPLFETMLKRLSRGRPVVLSSAAIDAMCRHGWPGNVREVKFTLQRALELCDGQIITPEDLMIEEAIDREHRRDPVAEPVHTPKTARAVRANAERGAIVDALVKNDGNIERTAAALNVSRATLYRKLKLHDLHK